MEQQDNLTLARILESLDAAIQTAIAKPECAGIESLRSAEALCRNFNLNDAPAKNTPGKLVAGHVNQQSPGRSVELLWEIRARLGRLKMLLEAAAGFYRGLASSPSAGMDYNVQGEWAQRAGGSLLQLDC